MRTSVIMLVAALLLACTTVGTTADPVVLAKSSGQGSDEAAALNHYLVSIVLERTGKYEEAIEELRKAADLYPDSDLIQLKLLGAYFQLQDYENAAVMARRAIKSDPDNVLLYIWLGRIYYQLDDIDAAVETFRDAVELDPESRTAYEFLVQIEEETNDLIGAIGVYEQLVVVSPDAAFLRYRLGRNLLEIKEYETARLHLEKALELDPELTPAAYLLGTIYAHDENFEKAVASFKIFADANPENVGSRVNMAGSLARMGRHDAAIETLTGLVESAHMEPEHHVERMFVYLLRGHIDDPSLAIVPSRVPIFGTLLQALIRKQAGEPYAKLIEGLDEIEGDLDTECSAYLNDVLYLFGEQEAGAFLEAQLRALLGEGLKSRVVEVVLGRTLMTMDRHEEAGAVMRAVLENYEPDKFVHYYLATIYDDLDQFRDTEKHLRAYLELAPDDADVMNFLGYVFAENNAKLDEAEALLERALELDPENGFYLDSLGWIYYRKGDGERAVDLIKRAIRNMNSDDAILRDHLGDAYRLSGDIERAVQEWSRAARLDPELEGVREKLEKFRKRIGE